MSAKMNLPLLGGGQWVTPKSNPVSWSYFVNGSDMGGNLDQARMSSFEEDWEAAKEERERRRHDWHYDAPKTHWRQKNGRLIAIARMSDDHLGHCIRFAGSLKQHKSRYWALIAERNQRERSPGPRPRRTTLPRGRGDC